MNVQMLHFPVTHDPTGNLTPIEWYDLPFTPKRVFYLHDVPGGARRGGHAHRELQEIIIALSGSFDVRTYDEKGERRWPLNRADGGLYIPPNVWRHLDNFSSNAIALVLASTPYDASDYIRDPLLFREGLATPEEPYFERRAHAASLEELQRIDR